MNRGKVRKAREGKIVAGPSPNYGYRFNESRDAYLVDEEKMAVARRVFKMVGAKGMTLNSARRALEDEGIPSPSGRRRWNKMSMRNLITDDVYLSRTFEEIAALVSTEVAARLDTDALYGVWWYGKERHVFSQERGIGPDGTPRYRKTKKSTPVPEDLNGLTPEQRRTLYRMMRLTVLATPDSEPIAEWSCNESTAPLGSFRTRGR